MSEMDPKFDDPVLKEALRRACGREVAPPHLHARIQRAVALQEILAPTTAARRTWPWRSWEG